VRDDIRGVFVRVGMRGVFVVSPGSCVCVKSGNGRLREDAGVEGAGAGGARRMKSVVGKA